MLEYSEKTEITEEAQKIIKTIKQMEASLEGSNSRGDYDLETGDLRVSYPLNRCLQGLKERYNNVSKAHRERFEQVKSTYAIVRSPKKILTRSRTRPGSRIVLFPSRTILHQD